MNKLKPGIFVRFLFVSSLAVSAALLYFYLFQYLPSQHRLMESQLISRARAVCDLSARPLARALETRDDLALVGLLEDIKKLDDVSSVYILDTGGTVLTHDRVSEWNKTYADPVSKKAAAANGRLIQRTAEPPGYLFSSPLTPRAVLCVALSSQKMDDSMALVRRNAFYSGVTVFVLVMLVLGGFMYYVPGSRFGKLREMLRNVAPGAAALPAGPSDELGELTRLMNEALKRVDDDRIAGLQRADEAVQRLAGLFRGLTGHLDRGVMVLDAENRIISANDAVRNSLLAGAGDVSGRHFLEVIRSPRLIELVKRASLEPDKAVEEKIDGLSIRVIAVADPRSGIQSGIIIIV